jgi:EmrB/QacA subfamily drug resistance transporter
MSTTLEPEPAQVLTRLAAYPWLVVATTCIGAFMGQLDASIVQLAMPEFERVFNLRISNVSWIATAYLIAFAAVLPIFGRLAAIKGRKLFYIAGFILFTGASALCGLASNFGALVGFRVLQGIGGAMLGANSIAILVKATNQQQRGQALGLFAAAQAIGAGAGPVFGGIILDTLGWRWIFWTNVPLGLIGAIAGYLVFPVTKDLDPDKRFYWGGALILTPALISLVAALSEIHAWGPTSMAFLSVVASAAILLPLFAWQERRMSPPLVNMTLFSNPAFSGGIVAVILSYAMLYSMFFVMSFSLVRGYQETPSVAGLHLALAPIGLGLTASFSGPLVDRLGAWATKMAAIAIVIAALAVLSFVMTSGAGGLWGVLAGLALFGSGLGLFIAPNNTSTMSAASPALSSQAAALLSLMRVVGTSVGVAAAGSLLSWRLETHGGAGGGSLGVSPTVLNHAAVDGLAMVGVFAILAALAVSIGRRSAVTASN